MGHHGYRRLLQLCSAILYNCNLISDIPAKYINSEFCVPGLNCRYCPTSVAGCPLNFMQRLFADELAYLPLRVLCWLLLLALAFCRFICPNKCVHCNACLRTCKMDIRKVGDSECISCGDCKAACKFGAIRFGGEKKTN